MNLEKNPTVEELQSLLNACDDRAGHHVLWVDRNADVHVSRVPNGDAPGWPAAQPDMQLRYETFQAGNEYVGPGAAADDGWVRQLLDALLTEWPKAKGQPTVGYLDQF